MNIVSATIWAFAAAVASGSALSQSAKQRGTSQSAAKLHLATAFQLDASSIGLNFVGHDCVDLVNRLKQVAPAKTEFESKDAFLTRVRDLTGKPLTAQLALGQPVAFPLSDFTTRLSYDAERGEAKLSIFKIFEKAIIDQLGYKSYPAISVATLSSNTRAFDATNAYGARVRIEETTAVKCGVGMVNDIDIEAHANPRLPMEPARAKALQSNIGAILVVIPKAPYYGRLSGGYRATLTSPTQLVISGDSLIAEAKGVWYYDKRTGEVVAKAEIPAEVHWPSPESGNAKAAEPAKTD